LGVDVRYFASDLDGRPNTLYRFDVSGSDIVEEKWTGVDWVPSNVPSEHLVEGQHDIWELSYETARKFFPI
jgi:hypothetical protein